MTEINLLPIDLSPARQVFKVAASLKKISYIILGTFLLIGTLGVIYIVFLRVSINSSTSRQQALTNNIQNLESTEQKLFLTKDRIDKIKVILADSKKADAYYNISQILSALPGDVVPYSVEIDSNRAKFSVLSKSSVSMAEFLNFLVASGSYKKLSLLSFIFTPDRGYLITLGEI